MSPSLLFLLSTRVQPRSRQRRAVSLESSPVSAATGTPVDPIRPLADLRLLQLGSGAVVPEACSDFALLGAESVGPAVGADLKNKAQAAIGFSLAALALGAAFALLVLLTRRNLVPAMVSHAVVDLLDEVARGDLGGDEPAEKAVEPAAAAAPDQAVPQDAGDLGARGRDPIYGWGLVQARNGNGC